LRIDPSTESDYGDAPDTYGTLKASGRPWHVIDSPLLIGIEDNPPDAEADGQPSAGADGDDLTDSNDDDGITEVAP